MYIASYFEFLFNSAPFIRYNFVLNKALNNNNVSHMANIVLNESPNSNVAMCVPNNVHLTTMGAHQFSMMAA